MGWQAVEAMGKVKEVVRAVVGRAEVVRTAVAALAAHTAVANAAGGEWVVLMAEAPKAAAREVAREVGERVLEAMAVAKPVLVRRVEARLVAQKAEKVVVAAGLGVVAVGAAVLVAALEVVEGMVVGAVEAEAA